jgi:hypothetical protein
LRSYLRPFAAVSANFANKLFIFRYTTIKDTS